MTQIFSGPRFNIEQVKVTAVRDDIYSFWGNAAFNNVVSHTGRECDHPGSIQVCSSFQPQGHGFRSWVPECANRNRDCWPKVADFENHGAL
jgi:hypothetical protein